MTDGAFWFEAGVNEPMGTVSSSLPYTSPTGIPIPGAPHLVPVDGGVLLQGHRTNLLSKDIVLIGVTGGSFRLIDEITLPVPRNARNPLAGLTIILFGILLTPHLYRHCGPTGVLRHAASALLPPGYPGDSPI
jgi:hypothetical protein